MQPFARIRAPQADGTVTTSGSKHLAVGCKRQGGDSALVSAQELFLPPRADIRDTDQSIIATGGERFPVGRKGNRSHGSIVTHGEGRRQCRRGKGRKEPRDEANRTETHTR